MCDESIYEFIPSPPPIDVKEFLKRHSPRKSKISFGAYINGDRKLPVGLLEVEISELGDASIGYLIDKSYWGQGIASQMIKWAILDLSPSLRSFHASVDSRNKGSIRALEKNEFVFSEERPNMLKFQASIDLIYRRNL